MSIYKIIPLLFLTISYGHSTAADIITSYSAGTVRVGKHQKKLKVNNISYTHRDATGVYMGGYMRDRSGKDIPTIGYISYDLKEEKYWPFETGFAQFFTFKDELYILDYVGNTFYKTNDGWRKAKWQFPPSWDVVYSDKFIIACHPHDIAKEAAPTRNGCVAPEKKWEINIDWAFVKPTMCNNVLTIWEYTHAPNAWTLPNDLVQFDPETGKEIARKHGVKQVKDICSIKFN